MPSTDRNGINEYMRISYPYRSISGANTTNGEANRAWRSPAMKRSRTIDIRTVNPQNTQLIARNAMTSEPNTEIHMRSSR